jgi:hypothetical protein
MKALSDGRAGLWQPNPGVSTLPCSITLATA